MCVQFCTCISRVVSNIARHSTSQVSLLTSYWQSLGSLIILEVLKFVAVLDLFWKVYATNMFVSL